MVGKAIHNGGIQMRAKRMLLAALTSLMLCASPASAQSELEYALELGVMAGGSFYLGDANTGGLYKNTKMAAGLMGRYNFNPRMSLKFDIAYGGIAGQADPSAFPVNGAKAWKFDKKLYDVGAQFELSFWGYGVGGGYKGHKRLTPYIQMGLGTTSCDGVFALNIPLGFGIKYKLKPRWNVGVDWSMRFTFSDKLDGISDPLGIKSTGFKNKDSYGLTMFYISYDLCPKYRKCNNEM